MRMTTDEWPCDWLIEYRDEDGVSTRECGAPCRETDTGWACQRGHEHVTAQVRAEQGWDYAADPSEATLLARYGTEPRDMATGGAFQW